MFDLMGKLQELKEKVEETRKGLEEIKIEGEAGDGKVKVEATAARSIENIEIAGELLDGDRKEELEELLIVALNNTLSRARETEEAELKKAAGGMLPPGLGL